MSGVNVSRLSRAQYAKRVADFNRILERSGAAQSKDVMALFMNEVLSLNRMRLKYPLFRVRREAALAKWLNADAKVLALYRGTFETHPEDTVEWAYLLWAARKGVTP